MQSLKGIIPALLTPFDASGSVREESLRRMVQAGIERGVRGFYVCGSTGEAFLLTPAERKRILEIVVEAAGGRAAVVCHIGAIGTDLTLDLGRHAVATGADAVSSIPPFYYKFSEDEIAGYYLDIAEALDCPVIPYNFPNLSGVTLNAALMRRLREDSRIVGVKFTSNDLFQLERMRKADPDLLILNGFDEVFLAGLAMGADGAIGSTFNFMPEKFLGIERSFRAGDLAAAKRLQDEANEVIQVIIKTGKLLNAQKYLVELQGIPCGECRRPFLPLTAEDRAALERVARELLVLPA